MSGPDMWRRPPPDVVGRSRLQEPPKKSRKKTFSWCRRPNGFSDNPRWRVVSKSTGISLATVIAFVNRLEERANDAANRGDIRGSITGFSALEFAAALEVSVEQAKALFTSLAHPDIGWIADGVIADFHDRNPDLEDPTATERQRRHRARHNIRERLDNLVLTGKLLPEQRAEFVSGMTGLNHDELIGLQMEIDNTVENVTRDSLWSRRYSVTVTPDQMDQNTNKEMARNTTSSASGSSVGLAREETVPEKTDSNISDWLREEGPKFIVQRMAGSLEIATRRIRDWSVQVGERVLFNVLQGATDLTGTAFHLEVADQIRRWAGYPALPQLGG
jgi:hypothetical protein